MLYSADLSGFVHSDPDFKKCVKLKFKDMFIVLPFLCCCQIMVTCTDLKCLLVAVVKMHIQPEAEIQTLQIRLCLNS